MKKWCRHKAKITQNPTKQYEAIFSGHELGVSGELKAGLTILGRIYDEQVYATESDQEM